MLAGTNTPTVRNKCQFRSLCWLSPTTITQSQTCEAQKRDRRWFGNGTNRADFQVGDGSRSTTLLIPGERQEEGVWRVFGVAHLCQNDGEAVVLKTKLRRRQLCKCFRDPIMKKLLLFTFIVAIAFAIFIAANPSQLLAQQATTDANWQQAASERLKGIYERREFNPTPFDPQWLADSSGYTVRELNPETEKEKLWQYDVNSGERTLAEASKKPKRSHSPDGRYRLERQNRRVVLREIETGKEVEVVKAADDRDVSYRSLSWSPDGSHISFVEVDRSEVRFRSVLVPGDPSYPGTEQHRFPRVGGKIDSLRVGIVDAGIVDAENVDAKEKQVHWVPLESPEEGFYLGKVAWTLDSNQLLIETHSRFRDKREFWLASVDGKLDRIFEEVNKAWAIASHRINSGAKWIDDGKAFIFISEKEGWRQAYRLSRDGKQETKLTPGKYDITDRVCVDEIGGWYYFLASPDNATQRYLYRVGLDGSGKLERVTPEDQPGTHEYDVSTNAKYAIHTWSSLNSPPVIDLVELPSHKSVRVLVSNKKLKAKADSVIKNPTEFVKIDIGDGVVLDASLTKPSQFDASKKYPVFVYVYGEPHLQTVLDRWGAAQIDFHRVVADTGYIVVSIDNRGTACPKGGAWRRSVFGSLGPLSTQEQAAAIKKLGQMKSFIDLSRVGIWGWSGGGSNTLNAMFRQPDVYHVGIAVVPKPQPWLYNAWFQEIYMRTREVNPEGYEKSAPINFAQGLAGKLLIITGSGETNTHIQIIEGLVDRLIELGKPFDYMVYPNRDHGLREGEGTVVHVRMLILRYLIENLPRGPK